MVMLLFIQNYVAVQWNHPAGFLGSLSLSFNSFSNFNYFFFCFSSLSDIVYDMPVRLVLECVITKLATYPASMRIETSHSSMNLLRGSFSRLSRLNKSTYSLSFSNAIPTDGWVFTQDNWLNPHKLPRYPLNAKLKTDFNQLYTFCRLTLSF